MIRTARTDDASDILAIYTPFVTDTAVSFELAPPTVEEMAGRIEETTRKYPWLVFEQGHPHPNPSPSEGRGAPRAATYSLSMNVIRDRADSPIPSKGDGLGVRVAGYAYASGHRARAAYQWSVEVSVYVRPEARRGGIARTLYTELFKQLRAQGFYNAFAGITLPNPASVGFHESMGFQPIGVFPAIGYKRGKWHDVGWWHLRLQDSDEPSPPPLPPLDRV